jgi:DNA-binding LacI/PurR family transcriptional regulator
MNTVGLVLVYNQPSVTSDPYLGPCLDGILDVNKRNRQKTVIFTEDSWADALENLPSYCDGHCDGLMLIIPRLDSEIVPVLKRRNTPFLLVGDSRDDPGLMTVDVDNVGASREAIGYLAGLGHRRIAAFGGNQDFCSNNQRLQGYREGLEEAGVPFDPALAFPGEYWPDSGYANLRALLDRYPSASERPTALFCFNDKIALGALRALEERSIAVPAEMSVIGFDDIIEAAASHPALTTVRQPIRQVGGRAAELLLARINGNAAPGMKEVVPAKIVVRESTAPPQGQN